MLPTERLLKLPSVGEDVITAEVELTTVQLITVLCPLVMELLLAQMDAPTTLQDWVLQLCEAEPEQDAPPFSGEGLLQDRVCVPPPQVTLQAPGAPTAIYLLVGAAGSVCAAI